MGKFLATFLSLFRALFRLTWRDWRSLRRLPASLVKAVLVLRPGDIVIDCGANSGRFTTLFARLGARVFSFEPDPIALDVLRQKTAAFSNVKVLDAAVGTANGEASLFFHEHRSRDPLRFSSGSSLDPDKPNVGADWQMVRTVDLAQFILGIGAVSAVKIDIEGYETVLVPHLVRSGATASIREMWVETHEKKWPLLETETARMISLAHSEAAPTCKIRFDWP